MAHPPSIFDPAWQQGPAGSEVSRLSSGLAGAGSSRETFPNVFRGIGQTTVDPILDLLSMLGLSTKVGVKGMMGMTPEPGPNNSLNPDIASLLSMQLGPEQGAEAFGSEVAGDLGADPKGLIAMIMSMLPKTSPVVAGMGVPAYHGGKKMATGIMEGGPQGAGQFEEGMGNILGLLGPTALDMAAPKSMPGASRAVPEAAAGMDVKGMLANLFSDLKPKVTVKEPKFMRDAAESSRVTDAIDWVHQSMKDSPNEPGRMSLEDKWKAMDAETQGHPVKPEEAGAGFDIKGMLKKMLTPAEEKPVDLGRREFLKKAPAAAGAIATGGEVPKTGEIPINQFDLAADWYAKHEGYINDSTVPLSGNDSVLARLGPAPKGVNAIQSVIQSDHVLGPGEMVANLLDLGVSPEKAVDVTIGEHSKFSDPEYAAAKAIRDQLLLFAKSGGKDYKAMNALDSAYNHAVQQAFYVNPPEPPKPYKVGGTTDADFRKPAPQPATERLTDQGIPKAELRVAPGEPMPRKAYNKEQLKLVDPNTKLTPNRLNSGVDPREFFKGLKLEEEVVDHSKMVHRGMAEGRKSGVPGGTYYTHDENIAKSYADLSRDDASSRTEVFSGPISKLGTFKKTLKIDATKPEGARIVEAANRYLGQEPSGDYFQQLEDALPVFRKMGYDSVVVKHSGDAPGAGHLVGDEFIDIRPKEQRLHAGIDPFEEGRRLLDAALKRGLQPYRHVGFDPQNKQFNKYLATTEGEVASVLDGVKPAADIEGFAEDTGPILEQAKKAGLKVKLLDSSISNTHSSGKPTPYEFWGVARDQESMTRLEKAYKTPTNEEALGRARGYSETSMAKYMGKRYKGNPEAGAGIDLFAPFREASKRDRESRGKVPLLRSERTGSRVASLAERAVEGSLPGAGPFQRFRAEQQTALASLADSVVDSIKGKKGKVAGGPEEVGMKAQSALLRAQEGLKSQAGALYAEVDSLAQGTKVKTAAVKAFAKDLQKAMKAEGKLVPAKSLERARDIVNRLAKAPNEVTFEAAQDARSDMAAMARASGDLIPGKAAGVAKKVAQMLDSAMQEAAAGKPELMAKLREANSIWKETADTFNDSVISRMVKEAPEKVHVLLAKASLEDLRRAKKLIPAETMQEVKAQIVRDMIDTATEGELVKPSAELEALGIKGSSVQPKLKGPSLRKALERFGEDRLKEIYTPEELQGIQSVAEVADRVGKNQGGWVSTIINYPLIYSAMHGTVTGSPGTLAATGAAAGSINLLARVMTKPWGARTIREFLQASAISSNRAAFWGARVGEQMKQEKGKGKGAKPKPTPFPTPTSGAPAR